MSWKKVLKYLLIIFALGCIVFVYLAQRDMNRIYGGLTEQVDPAAFKSGKNSVLIRDVNVLSQNGERFISNQSVIVEDGLIVAVDSTIDDEREMEVINGEGKFLIPGLIDSHVHLFKSPNDLLLYVANGVTEIREMIGEEDHLQWRKEIEQGRVGPDMYIASPRLGSFGMIEGWFMGWAQGFNTINNEEDAQSLIEEYASKGYDGVKVYSFLNKEAYEATSRIADSKGFDVIGHIPWSIEFDDFWKSNQKEISHLEELMNAFRREFGSINGQEDADNFLTLVDKRSREIVPNLIDNNISVTTTLWLTESFVRQKFNLDQVLNEVELAYVNPGISEWNERIPQGLGWLPEVNRYKMMDASTLSTEELEKRRIFWETYAEACKVILKNLHEGGVKLMAGTDANLPPTVPGFSLHDELLSLSKAGMSPSQALQAATSVPAEWLGSNTGRIAEGYKANLVLLDKNPLDDLNNTKTINTVIIGGRIFNRTILNNMLTAVKIANDESRTVDISEYAGN